MQRVVRSGLKSRRRDKTPEQGTFPPPIGAGSPSVFPCENPRRCGVFSVLTFCSFLFLREITLLSALFPAVVIAKCSKRSDFICCVSFTRNWRLFLYSIAFAFPLSLFTFVVSCPFYFFLSLYCFPPSLPEAEGLLQNVKEEKRKSDKQIDKREQK